MIMQQMRARPTQIRTIRSGRGGTSDTLNIMRRLVKAGRKNPLIRQTALDVVRPVDERNWKGEIIALQEFVKKRVRYTRDPVDVECVQEPWVTLQQGQGDCDDSAILLASLLETVGHPTKLRAISMNPLRKNQFCHVLVMTRVGDAWLSAETILDVPLGWIPPNVTNIMDRHI